MAILSEINNPILKKLMRNNKDTLDYPIFKVRMTKDRFRYYFWCPNCAKEHFHGTARNPKENPDLGHRISHCKKFKEKGYVLFYDGKNWD